MTVSPDVVIKRGAAGFEVEVLGFENLALHINPHYRNLYESIRTARPRAPSTASTAAAHRRPPESMSSPMSSGRTCS